MMKKIASDDTIGKIKKKEVRKMKVWKHFKTITHHRILVCKGCFKIGLYWQGLMHTLLALPRSSR